MDVYAFALKMELDGKDHYLQLAAKTGIAGLKNIFLQLAEDEQKHYDIFQKLKQKNAPSMRASTALEDAKNIFVQLADDKPSSLSLEDDLDGYLYAMKLEAESFRFYETSAAGEPEASTRTLLLQIADEEHNHFNILQNVYDFVNAPNQFLAWVEFSNLDEFRNFGRGNLV